METSPRKKRLVRHLAIALGISFAGFACCAITLFRVGEHRGWIESQRVHPTLNPVYYAAALDMVHDSWFWVIPLLGALFLLIAITVCLLWRDAKNFG